ncbi:MAG: alpha/beta hydrolase [Pirellulales bacterium]|nr:alpha/beta hydrolase [Pirellulales bacterium]
MQGNVPTSLCAHEARYEDISNEAWKEARGFRRLCYYRVTTPQEAISLLRWEREIRFACEITSDWYDPPDGILPALPTHPEFIDSHAVPIVEFNIDAQRFVFPNSWGADWGRRGWGELPEQDWNRCVISAWDTVGLGLFVPNTIQSGIAVRGWKWGVNAASGVHCIDIYDVDRDEYLAWAFCVVRGSTLDVDEFFVQPDERGKGHARELKERVQQLADAVRKPLRLIVSFADTESHSIDGAAAAARLFGVELVEADERWASLFGTAGVARRPSRNWKPMRPGSILEKLRPRSEPPIQEPRQYTVFYGTNRKPVDEDNQSMGFRNERGYQLHRGSCLVEVPATHKFGSVGRTWLGFLDRSKTNKLRLVGTQALSRDELILFAGHLIRRFDYASEKHNLLYIHGYNCSFADAAKRAAQIGVDLKINGATFFFSWPSAAATDGYFKDEASIETCDEYCQQFVLELLGAYPDMPLHILAHSMGNRLAVHLLEKLAARKDIPGKLGQLIFAAADIDVDRFKQALTAIKHLPRRLTSYVSRGDLALHLSEKIHDFPRLGLAPPILRVEGVDTMLAEDFRISELLGHGYYAEAGRILTDLFCLIRHDSPPDDRPGTRRETDSSSPLPFWSLAMN